MAFKLSDIKEKIERKPPRILIHGTAGLGKTTLAASIPGVIFIQTEDGLAGVADVPHFPLAKSYEDVMSALHELANESHKFKALALDSLDWLEALIWQKVCENEKVDSIDNIAYGKGYKLAVLLWQKYIDYLNQLRSEKNMIVMQLAHTSIRTFYPPDGESYDRYEIALHKAASAKLQEHSDIVAFGKAHQVNLVKSQGKMGKQEKRAVSSGERKLFLTEQPAWLAKNRYAMSESIDFSWDAIISDMKGDSK
jgi:hypothetical protein